MLHFVVGTGRCGTNLLNRMLACHPQITAVTETHFIATLATRFADEQLSPQDFWTVLHEHYTSNGQHRWIDAHLEAGSIEDKDIFLQQFIEKSRIRTTHAARVRLFLELCYEKTAASEPRFFLDKTPQYGLQIPAISRLFPSAKFVHLIRDGRLAAASMAKHKGISRLIKGGHPDALANFSYQAQISHIEPYQASMEEAVLYWEKVVEATRTQATELPDNQYLELYYEDLIIKPRVMLQRVCDFLEIPSDGLWKFKGMIYPNPQAFVHESTRLRPDEYELLTDLTKNTLSKHNYFTGNFETFKNKKTSQIIYNQQFRNFLRNFFKVS